MKSYAHEIKLVPLDQLKPYPGNARTHSNEQVRQIVSSITEFGFTNPVLIDDKKRIIAGHGRVCAAKQLAMETVPTICLSQLSQAQIKAYVLADNKLALNAGWDQELLAIELQGLIDFDFDVSLTGFSTTEIDLTFEIANQDDANALIIAPEDMLPEPLPDPITQKGDLWFLGNHKLLCGDAQSAKDFETLLGPETADLVFTDPPYNVAIEGNVCGSGKIKHDEFAFASGEMTTPEFTRFLSTTFSNVAAHSKAGAIAYVCMDWRHMREVLDAGERAIGELKNLCIWNKTNGGMGSFYRSKHELVFVFKKPGGPHQNNFGLGEQGRYRTNVWDYAGISSFGAARDEQLAMHPTVKPVAMIADAIKDCSAHGDLVLDCFGGSGSTLIAAEQTSRKARLIEFEPTYCDVIIQRWQKLTGKQATLATTGERFEALARTSMRNSITLHKIS